MGYAEDIIKELLLEEVEQEKVTYAIKKRHEVSFRYDSNDGDPRGKKERITVQPVALGTTKAGNPCFRAYQVNGSSESGEKGERPVPGWRLFLLDRVVPNTWRDSKKVFNEPPMYNPNGDDTMAEVLVRADFTGSANRYERGGLKKYNKERHDKAVEKNPYYDFEKQVKNKQMVPDFVMKNIKDTAKSPHQRDLQWQQASNERLKGNQQSVVDMSRQTDFGDEGFGETEGPVRKGDTSVAQPQQAPKQPDYKQTLQNGPVYKTINNKSDKIINNDGNGFDQRPGESSEDDDKRGL